MISKKGIKPNDNKPLLDALGRNSSGKKKVDVKDKEHFDDLYDNRLPDYLEDHKKDINALESVIDLKDSYLSEIEKAKENGSITADESTKYKNKLTNILDDARKSIRERYTSLYGKDGYYEKLIEDDETPIEEIENIVVSLSGYQSYLISKKENNYISSASETIFSNRTDTLRRMAKEKINKRTAYTKEKLDELYKDGGAVEKSINNSNSIEILENFIDSVSDRIKSANNSFKAGKITITEKDSYYDRIHELKDMARMKIEELKKNPPEAPPKRGSSRSKVEATREQAEIIAEGEKKYMHNIETAGAVSAYEGLNVDQQVALFELLDFSTNKDKKSVAHILYGPGGSGKTFMLKVYAQVMTKNKKNVVFAATTNKASIQLQESVGSALPHAKVGTINSGFGLGGSAKLSNYEDFGIIVLNGKGDLSQLRSGEIAIIDETSMMNELMFSHAMNEAKKKGFKIIFTGDDAQLPPIRDGETKALLKQYGFKETAQSMSLITTNTDAIPKTKTVDGSMNGKHETISKRGTISSFSKGRQIVQFELTINEETGEKEIAVTDENKEAARTKASMSRLTIIERFDENSKIGEITQNIRELIAKYDPVANENGRNNDNYNYNIDGVFDFKNNSEDVVYTKNIDEDSFLDQFNAGKANIIVFNNNENRKGGDTGSFWLNERFRRLDMTKRGLMESNSEGLDGPDPRGHIVDGDRLYVEDTKKVKVKEEGMSGVRDVTKVIAPKGGIVKITSATPVKIGARVTIEKGITAKYVNTEDNMNLYEITIEGVRTDTPLYAFAPDHFSDDASKQVNNYLQNFEVDNTIANKNSVLADKVQREKRIDRRDLFSGMESTIMNLSLSYAINAHKAQGMTVPYTYVMYDNIMVKRTNSRTGETFYPSDIQTARIMYVAASRASKVLTIVSENKTIDGQESTTEVINKDATDIPMETTNTNDDIYIPPLDDNNDEDTIYGSDINTLKDVINNINVNKNEINDPNEIKCVKGQ
jgi:ABC-type cobalamin/Fe3+-siderophores transport system ATPase subunit